jgi:hypothetical protein
MRRQAATNAQKSVVRIAFAGFAPLKLRLAGYFALCLGQRQKRA